MKILMVIPQLSMGGAERSFANVAQALSRDHEVDCVVFNDKDPVDYPMNVPLHSLMVTGGGSTWNRVGAMYRRYRNLRRLAKKIKPDAIISYLDGANWLNAMLPRKYRRIISQRGSVYQDITASNRRLALMKLLYRRVDCIVALNEDIKAEFATLGFDKVEVIPNFFDIHDIERRAREFEPQYSGFSFCMVGRLAPEKGYQHILQAAGRMKARQRLKASYYIVGDGPFLAELKSTADQEGLRWTDNETAEGFDVYFLGRKSNPYPYISKADALLIGSSAEGGPNVLLEAMICQTLIISANCPGAPRYRLVPEELISYDSLEPVFGSNGLLLPNFQRNDLETVLDIWAESLEKVAREEDTRSRMISNAYSFVQDFTASKVYEKWKEVVER